MESGAMRLYDRDIAALKEALDGMRPRKLPAKPAWECTDQEALVLRSEMAFELGGGEKEAVSGLAFTCADEIVPESGVYLAGGDLPDVRKDISYARMTLLLLEELEGQTPQEWYSLFRRIDYTRYHIYPKGYMMRISAVKEREPVRISGEALKEGMDFAGVGACFAQQYGKHPKVRAVQTYFVTDPAADYGILRNYAHRFEQITESMNQVFKGFSMDCNTCSQRQLCEEIDGLKELHRRSV